MSEQEPVSPMFRVTVTLTVVTGDNSGEAVNWDTEKFSQSAILPGPRYLSDYASDIGSILYHRHLEGYAG